MKPSVQSAGVGIVSTRVRPPSAVALHADAARVERGRRRAERRAAQDQPPRRPWQQPRARFTFRFKQSERPRWERPELRRRRVHDELLRGDEHPGLSPHVFWEAWRAGVRHAAGGARDGDPDRYGLPDGMTERAQRYRRQLAEGRWALPDDWERS